MIRQNKSLWAFSVIRTCPDRSASHKHTQQIAWGLAENGSPSLSFSHLNQQLIDLISGLRLISQQVMNHISPQQVAWLKMIVL